MDALQRHKNEFNELELIAHGAVTLVDDLVKEIRRLKKELKEYG